MPAKVGVLFLFAQQGFGADGAVHADIIRHLDRDRFEVHAACTLGDGAGTAESLEVVRTLPNVALRPTRFLPSFGQRDVASLLAGARSASASAADFLALARYVKRHRIAIVHSAERPRDAAYNVALAKLTGARSVVHVHVKWSPDYSPLARWAVRSADAVFSISRYVTSTLLAMGRSPATIHTILNGIGPSRWNPAIDGSVVRRELGISDDALVMSSVSRLFAWKGQRELLRAFALVRAEVPNVHLLIVGADSREAQGGSFTEELQALARTLGVSERVTFTGPRRDVPEIMAASDVFAMPSFEEPFGLVFLEAMAMKKPVVAVDNGGTPEVVEHGRSGLLSPAWDVPALSQNLLTLLRDSGLRATLGAQGRERMLSHFTAQRMARDASAAYRAVLGLSSND